MDKLFFTPFNKKNTLILMGVMPYHTDVPVAWMWLQRGEGGALAFLFFFLVYIACCLCLTWLLFAL